MHPAPAAEGEALGTVLVTGASGFIGARLVRLLQARGVAVRGLAHHRPAPAGVEAVRADLGDAATLRPALQGVGTVFHLAGIASAAAAAAAPDMAFRINTLGTQALLEAALQAGVGRVVLLSSAAAYGPPSCLPLTEAQPAGPASWYGVTKLAADTLALGCHRARGLPVSILRPLNVYGPGQTADAVVPTIVAQAVRGQVIRVRDPRPRRDFLYVDDVAEALLLAALRPGAAGHALLLASGTAVSVGSLARRVAALTGTATALPEGWEEDGSDLLYGDARLAADLLGWAPRVGLEEGLARTVAWWAGRDQGRGPEALPA